MRVKQSEYRRSFVRTPDKELSSDFESKFDYRVRRRYEEHRHTPFDWDYLSESDSDYEETVEPEQQERIKKIRDYEKRRQRDREILEDEGNRRLVRRGEQKAEHKSKDNKQAETNNERESSQSRRRRPQKPVAYRTIPKAAPLEGSMKRKARQEAFRDPVALFVPFGLGDKERETGALKTFNVRSSADVYPSALRAKKRLEYDVERREDLARCRPYIEPRQVDYGQKDKATSTWDSEYKNNYRGYEPGEYKRCRGISGGARFYVPL